jgi:HK97 family phage portal protein
MRMGNALTRIVERLMGRKPALAEKASGVGSLIALNLVGRPVWTPRDYAALAREGFAKNAIAYRAVRMIAESAAAVPWLLFEGARELAEHPLLRLLARPNPLQSGAELFEQAYAFLQVAGNAYLEAVTVEGATRELYSLRPDRMKVVPGREGWPEAYEYSVHGRTVTFAQPGEAEANPILHLKLFHPADDHYGMSPLEAAGVALDIHNAGSAWNKALLDNAAQPSGALIYKGPEGAPNLSSEQLARLKSELEERYQGAANAGRPLLLDGGLSWTAMSLTPQDMQFIEARHVAAREIALAFGVPPMLLGIPGDNTYSNYREANLAFWRGTVLPLVMKMAAALSAWLGPRFGPSPDQALRLDIDLDRVEALSSEREAMWARVNAASFLSDDEKREAVGYGRRDK